VRNHRQRDPPKSASKTLDRASYEEIIRDIRKPREKPRSMTLIALIRHAATGWNEGGRVQSTTDVPLSENGRETVRTWQAPPHIAEFDWISSPLSRAVETATILSGFPPSRTDERLIEMDWAVWEGMTITELKAEIGNPGEAWRAGGLDFKAPGGESQREVQYRLLAVFRELVEAGRPTTIVCHRGVVRATYSLAAKWNQTTPWPDTLADDCTHLFQLQANGHPEIAELNVPLTSG
jgi:broad specificity phosphatase PhoE